ncbi:TerC family protein [Rubrobacter taiwanensis]|uniref:TerC family protein n=1 Tax=Rubrobacter taiwanensis TaxID=185139 RepID=UPI001FB2E18B|nr:TerC family protein [Rubrobacter taiwanensis]
MLEFINLDTLWRFAGILLIDLILSGDNAVVIALAVRSLQGPARRRAILLGVAGAILLRIFFALIISYLLAIPFLQVAGGLLLLWIAWRLVFQEHDGHEEVREARSLWDAVKIIILADVVMSLDNVVALVGVAGGNVWLVAIGIALTIPLVIFGSTILAALMDRFPWIAYAGAALLVWVSVEMIFHDRATKDIAEFMGVFAVRAVGVVAVLAFLALVLHFRRVRRKKSEGAA